MLLLSSYPDNIKAQKNMLTTHWTTTTATTTENDHFFKKVIVNPSFELHLAPGPNCPIAVAASLGEASKNPTEGPGRRAGQKEDSAT